MFLQAVFNSFFFLDACHQKYKCQFFLGQAKMVVYLREKIEVGFIVQPFTV